MSPNIAVSALGLFLGSHVLDDIPVLDQKSVLHPDNIRRNPVDRQPETRETSVDDDEVSLRDDYSRFIPEGERNALDQVKETIPARLNVRTVLNVVGRPEALRCGIISLIEESVEGFQDDRLIVFCFRIVHYNFAFPPVCDRYSDIERMAEASIEARPQRERYSFNFRVKNFGGEDGIVRVSERRGAVVAFGALLVQRRVQSYAFHQIWIGNIFSAEGDEVSQTCCYGHASTYWLWVEWREDKELWDGFCPEGATGLSPGFQPWEPQNKRVRPEGARG